MFQLVLADVSVFSVLSVAEELGVTHLQVIKYTPCTLNPVYPYE